MVGCQPHGSSVRTQNTHSVINTFMIAARILLACVTQQGGRLCHEYYHETPTVQMGFIRAKKRIPVLVHSSLLETMNAHLLGLISLQSSKSLTKEWRHPEAYVIDLCLRWRTDTQNGVHIYAPVLHLHDLDNMWSPLGHSLWHHGFTK